MQFLRNIKPNAKLILEALERGEDPYETVVVAGEVKGGGGKAVGRKGQISPLAAALQRVFILFRGESETDINIVQKSKSASAPMLLLVASNSNSQLASSLTSNSSMMRERVELIARTSL